MMDAATVPSGSSGGPMPAAAAWASPLIHVPPETSTSPPVVFKNARRDNIDSLLRGETPSLFLTRDSAGDDYGPGKFRMQVVRYDARHERCRFDCACLGSERSRTARRPGAARARACEGPRVASRARERRNVA